MLVKFPIAGRAGTRPFFGVPTVKGTNEASNATGNEAELRAANANAGIVPGFARSSSVKVNRPSRSTSWTSVPYESVNRLSSPSGASS